MTEFTVALNRAAGSILLPPGDFLLLGVIGLFVMAHRPRLGRFVVIAALAAGYALSTPLVSDHLLLAVQGDPGSGSVGDNAGAIVVLGGGTREAPEYGGETVSRFTLERLRHAARLYRETGKSVLVTGGNPLGGAAPEGVLMRDTLVRDFRVPVAWVESRSNDTSQNARFSANILHAAGIDSIYLVTHAWHMPRARYAFERAGIRVLPQPVASGAGNIPGMLALLPSAGALHESALALHEILGLAWYRLLS
jgi:uncharacterized SAM-binding protein YcdF (DUF218 family)